NENNDKNDRYDDLEALLRTDLIFVLSTPFDVIAWRHADALGDDPLGFLDKSSDITAAHIHQDSPPEQPVLTRNHRWSHHETNPGDSPHGDWHPVRCRDQHVRERFNVFPEISGVSDTTRKTLPPFDRKRHILPADRGFDHVLSVADIDAVPGGRA